VSLKSASVFLLFFCSSIVAVSNFGCSREEEVIDFFDAEIAQSKVDDLSRSMDFITTEIRSDQAEFISGVMDGLNRWVSQTTAQLESVPWSPSSFSQPVLEEYQELPTVQRIDEFNFLNTDAYYIQQAHWIRNITDRLAANQRYQTFEMYRLAADDFDATKSDLPINEIFKKLNASIQTDEDATKLANTIKVFDWVCRNINLESDKPLTDSEIEDRILNKDETGAKAGVPGLGYQRFPWQTLLYGRGDYVERAKLISICLRHLDIESVVLATGDDMKPWALAVPIGDEYFLFDPKLGLPIPGEQTGSLATLSAVQKKPSLLTDLDLTTDESLADDTKYFVRPDDLKSLTGLIYLSPESFSRRMKGLQASLLGDTQLQLAHDLDDSESVLPKIEGVSFKPWDIAFKTHQYRDAVRVALEQSSSVVANKLDWYYLSENYVNQFKPYRTARGRYFQGKFHGIDETKREFNAMQGFQIMMYTDEDISNLASDDETQRRHGIRKDDQNSKDFNNVLNSVQSQMRLIRVDSKLFMAQCLFDNTNEIGAGGWLEDLQSSGSVTPGDEDSRWQDATYHLLGRSYESRKQYDDAVKFYQTEKLNQSHGNLLRARMLKTLIKKVYGS